MKIETMQDLVNELNNAIKMLGYCACETIGAVARDLNSTCQQCGGKDAYKSSPLQQVVKALQGKALVPVDEKLPNEQGTNRYGLDVAYFRKTINRELNRPLVDFKPSELARVFARLSRTADPSVLLEPEFQASQEKDNDESN